MRNFKKVVAAGLALLMLALSVNVSFAAENYTEKEAIVVAKVNAAGIMTGTDKGFEPSKTLTRAEAAAIFVRMKGISEDTVKQNAGATLFTDVAASHWAAGYVNVASNYSIIKGVGANKFAPEKEVTVAEFYTMAIRALNAGQLVEADGTWPTNYVNFAIENDLAEDVQQIYTAASTRMTAATIVANTLEATIWKKAGYKSNGEVEFTPTGGTVLASLNIEEKVNQTIEAIDTKKSKATVTAYGASTKFNERAGLANAKKGLGYTVWYDTKEKEVLGFWLPKDNKTVEFTDIKEFATSGDIKLVVNGEEEKFKGASATICLNEGTTLLTSFTKGTLPTYGIAYYGTEDANKDKITKIYAETYTNWGVVKKVENNTVKFDATVSGANAANININEEEDSNYVYRVTKDGKEAKITDIEEDDVIFYHVNGAATSKDYTINVFSDTVEGKVTAKANKTITVDGSKYDLVGSVSVNAGDEGTFYLAENGKVVMFAAEKKSTDVAMISAIKAETSNTVGSAAKLLVKYSTMDGQLADWKEVDLEKSYDNLTALGYALADYKTAYANLYAAPSGDITIASNKFVWDTHEYDSIGEAEAARLADAKTTAAASVTAISSITDSAKKKAVAFELLNNRALLGKVTAFEIKSSKFVVKKDGTGEDQEITTLSAFTDGEIDKITVADGATYYLADDAIAYELEDNKKSNEDKEITLKAIDLDELDSLTGLNGYAVDLDTEEKLARVLILDKTNIKSSKEWAAVIEVATYDDGDDDTDEDIQVTLLMAGESSTKTFIAKASDVKVSSHELTAGDICEFAFSGDVIKSVKETDAAASGKLAVDTTLTNKTYLVKEYNNGVIGLGKYTAAASGTAAAKVETAQAEFDSNVLVIKRKGAGNEQDPYEYKTSSKSALKFLDIKYGGTSEVETEWKAFNTENLKDVSKLVKVVTWTEDNETKVIAVVFVDDKYKQN